MLSYISAFRSPDEGVQQRPPRYAGEDTTPTSRREILGWYSYGIAAEVFAVCGVGSFLPLTLEQLARERGTLQTSRLPCIGPSAGNNTNAENGQCVVPIFGLEINTASFAMYTFSLAVLIQALTLISFSALADYENNRKTLLMVFGFAGALASMLFVFIAPPIFILGSILVVVGVTCLGSSFVVLNSYLPVLVANDPSLQDRNAAEMSSFDRDAGNPEWNDRGSDADDDSLDGLQPSSQRQSSLEGGMGSKAPPSSSPELQLSTKISSRGIGLGYCAAVFVQIISIIILITSSKTSLAKASPSLPMRFVLLLVGIWWGAFTLMTRNLLKARPGPPLDPVSTQGAGRWRAWLRLVGFAWKSLWNTVKVVMRLREVLIFLVAWFLLSDAIATVSGTAILFARTELKLSTPLVGLLSITATVSGMTGAFLWPHVSRYFGLQPNHTIILCIALFELIPLYGLLAYIPFIKNWGVFGLQRPWEIFPLAIVHGVVSGGLASYCRSFFGLLIPPGSEAAFYALYAATDKGSSFIGPAIVGVLVDATGQVRSGFFFIAILIILPIPLIWMVNADKGRREGLAMAETLGKSHGGAAEDAQEAEGLLARE
ncbi:Major facilitator superfamily domain general substrate transporter [Penicillium cf. griseofulvum]|uniref:Autophagy-related protein n=1 Tax=Penicillium cf. griseofulvum TaxID=2972120 RepID=A0A9W9J4R6_9EURO|nr:Major facilitator superfamily domain general substrate transporter [Penicillium cf. griseofulvum]KAJ5427509.1 Major facilitator superfamily domain general substrate transporter [Penicillium cf. griseofulvum]KAJ5431710.1 Major facilitator superfamily domain general substrate transporter [Penicillium cf. griseofulvum]